jgi:tetratricopeptide (TPR) repeat protein
MMRYRTAGAEPGRYRFTLLLSVLALATLWPPPAARADQLRNVHPGEELPPLDAAGLDGQPVKSADAANKVLVLVYLSARQKQSEEALASAHRVTSNLGNPSVKLLFISADASEADYFRQLRDRVMAHEPFALDDSRSYYGKLGLIVFPTTVVTDKAGKLRHVLASWTRDYEYHLELCCRQALGEFDEAELTKRLENRPLEKDDRRARADRHRAVAAILREKGMPDGAIAELEQALTADPGNADAALDLAGILVGQGKFDAAEKRVQEVLTTQPSHHASKLLLGLVQLKRDRLDEAETLLKEALAMNPDPLRAHYYLGQLYERKGDFRLAAEHYREALKRSLKER